VIVLASAGLTWPTAGVVLWLAVGLHSILAVWCAALSFRAARGARPA